MLSDHKTQGRCQKGQIGRAVPGRGGYAHANTWEGTYFCGKEEKGVAGFLTGQEVSLNRMDPRKQTKNTDTFLTASKAL